MTVIVLNHSRDGIVVHKPGCADIARAMKLRMVNSDWPVEVPDGVDPAAAVAADLNASFGWPDSYTDPDTGVVEDAPWAVSNIKVLPCVRRAT